MRISPDGNWATYTDVPQSFDEVALASFPDGDHRMIISPSEGGNAIWRRDGSEILYQNDRAVYSVAVEWHDDGSPSIGRPEVVVPFAERRLYIPERGFDISLDGTRLLLIRSRGGQEQQKLTVLENGLTAERD